MQESTKPWSRPHIDSKKEKLENIALFIILMVASILFVLLAVFLFLLQDGSDSGYNPKALVLLFMPVVSWYMFYSECQREKRKRRPIAGVRVLCNKASQVRLEDGFIWSVPYDSLKPYLGDWLVRDAERYQSPITDGENVKWKSGPSLSLYQISTLGLSYDRSYD